MRADRDAAAASRARRMRALRRRVLENDVARLVARRSSTALGRRSTGDASRAIRRRDDRETPETTSDAALARRRGIRSPAGRARLRRHARAARGRARWRRGRCRAARDAVAALLARCRDTPRRVRLGPRLRDLREIAEHADDDAAARRLARRRVLDARRGRRSTPRRRAADAAARRAAHEMLERRSPTLDGVWLEPKTVGFGVHTRRRRRRRRRGSATPRADAIVAGRGDRTGAAARQEHRRVLVPRTRARTTRSRSCAAHRRRPPCSSPATT